MGLFVLIESNFHAGSKNNIKILIHTLLEKRLKLFDLSVWT